MRDNNGIRRGIVEEITRGERGEKNENIALIAKFTQAQLGTHALRDITERWDDEDDLYRPPDRKLPTFRIVMMTLKRIRDPNQTIYLATSTEEMEENPGPDLEPQ